MNKNIIFIDANIYLRFYDSTSHNLKSLLNTLIELKEFIFVTEQICNEVHRNKLSVAMNSLLANHKSLDITSITLPEHLDNNTDEKLKQWNDRRKNILKEENKLKDEYSKIVSNTLSAIMMSKDNASKSLSIIFESAQPASGREMAAARLRKELGNPPGKSGDPIGDQLTWEQFLTQYSTQEIWLITNDSDYLTKYEKNFYLNSYLYNELKRKANNTPPKIHLFNSLAEGIKNYSLTLGTKINTLPSDIALEAIKSEEEKIVRNIVESSNISSIGYDGATLTLEIEFHNRSVYQYHDVPQEFYERMIASASMGLFFNQNIKNIFNYSKII